MAWELLLWLFSFAGIISLVGMSAYQLISLSDLEFDYINPFDTSSRINAVVIPEYLVQGILCALFLLTWHWFPFLIMAPITYFHMKLTCADIAWATHSGLLAPLLVPVCMHHSSNWPGERRERRCFACLPHCYDAIPALYSYYKVIQKSAECIRT